MLISKPNPGTMAGTIALALVIGIAAAAAIWAPGCTTYSPEQTERNREIKADLEALAGDIGTLNTAVSQGLAITNDQIEATSGAIAGVAEVLERERAALQALIDSGELSDAETAASSAYAERLGEIRDALQEMSSRIEATGEGREQILQAVAQAGQEITAIAARIPEAITPEGRLDPEATREIGTEILDFAPEPIRSIGLLGLAIATAVMGRKTGRQAERRETTQPLYHGLQDVVRGVESVLEQLEPETREVAEEELRRRQTNGTHKIVTAMRGKGVSGIVTRLESDTATT